MPRIKGVHNAIGSGMLAAEHVAAALGAGRANDELVDYENAWRDSAVGQDLYRVRNAKPLWSRFGTVIGVALLGFDMWCNTLGFSLFGTLSHAKPDRKTLDPAKGHSRSPIRSRTARFPSTSCRRYSSPTPIMKRISRFI